MAVKWQKANFPGIRFREHPTRKHGVKKDRYFSIYYRFNGKRKEEVLGWSSKGWTEKKANNILSGLQENHRIGNGPQTLKEMRLIENEKRKTEQDKLEQEKINDITFGSFFKEVYSPTAAKHKKQYTVQNETSLYNKWLDPEIGHLPFNKIKPFNLEKIKKNMLDAGRAPRSLQLVFATCRQIWNHARTNDLIDNDCPTRKVKIPKIKNKRLRFFSSEEADILLGALKSKSQQVHDITLFSLHTGARAGEIFSLTWGVVDLENGTAQLRDSKGADRHAYLTDATQTMFARMYQDQSPSELVFKDNNGRQIIKISKTFGRTIKNLGFNDGVTDRRDRALFHTCRHTFASWHVQNGTDLYTVKELLGHSTIQLTERYSHLRPDGLKKAARNFDEKVIKNNIIKLEKTENA
jgi:integrase